MKDTYKIIEHNEAITSQGDSPIINIEPPRNIIITNKDGKKLTLDFKDKLTLSGDLEYDEAAKIFIENLKYVWETANNCSHVNIVK